MVAEKLDGLCWPLRGVDPMTLELDAFCTKALASPLSFPLGPGKTSGCFSPSQRGTASPPPNTIDPGNVDVHPSASRSIFAVPNAMDSTMGATRDAPTTATEDAGDVLSTLFCVGAGCYSTATPSHRQGSIDYPAMQRSTSQHALLHLGGAACHVHVSSSNLQSLLRLPMIDGLCPILCWNVRGLNTPARHEAVCELASAARAGILCLQETKLHHIDVALACDIAGPLRSAYAFLPADGTRAGIAIFWNPDTVDVNNFSYQRFSISVTVSIRASGLAFTLSSVYGPADNALKPDFLQEMKELTPTIGEPWLIVGDFNLIYEAHDKNNTNLCRRLMGQFRPAIDHAELFELRCSNRKFSWSNERENPTLLKLDRIFCNTARDALFSPCAVQALSTAHSDHCPLLLAPFSLPPRKARFRFENFWPRHQGFLEAVSTAWNVPALSRNPLVRLRIKLGQTARSLRAWSKGLFGDARQQLHLAVEIVLRLDEAQDHRPLSPLEFHVRKALKIRVLGLAAVERARRRQASRHVWLKEGDANTRFFNVMIGTPSGIHVSHEDKASALFQHFDESRGRTAPRTRTLAWQELHLPRLPLASIDNPFSLCEIWEAVKASPTEKALGPDGFIGTFYRRCWSVIKFDVLAAFHHLHRLAGDNLDALNTALICLICHQSPISLIHSFAKLFAKVLARRLTPLIGDLISHAQSAFLKTRCIHDNFLFVRNTARALHRAKKPTLLVKLDFAKAFDSVSWEYLLELMLHLGFPSRWRDWIVMLFFSASSSVILNGTTGNLFYHRRGLRQGDPLSPPLFILAIDPLQRILLRATELGALSPLPLQCVSLRASLYADDAIVFINPSRPDLQTLLSILDTFGTATGLGINMAKCSVAPIRCTNIDLDDVLQPFLGERVDFPFRYLGLPLSLGRLRLAHLQPILDRARTKLAGWHGKWINAGGRRALVSSVLSSLPIYTMTALRLPRCFISALDKARRRFIWGIEEEEAARGKCKVSWDKVWCGLAAWQNCNGIAGALRADHRALTDFLDCILDLSADGHKKGVNSLIILTCWTIWQERNTEISGRQLLVFIKDAAQDWAFAGAKALRKLLWESP
ncbi:uncharacterized protein LOC104584074 [Brachypodium distachyon]|uniref:uncharacterized protein LOC104584074 n=1 Tax=Brachypodium distachyon TaxID=15368 RepID=UPI00053007B3|nr:uncharacterized protein LOC104584074 [Brachypodium distachyon]|eukprot:XP_010236490.1 uncharacterized protein LOC104584074 [Brachypodium distachyon]